MAAVTSCMTGLLPTSLALAGELSQLTIKVCAPADMLFNGQGMWGDDLLRVSVGGQGIGAGLRLSDTAASTVPRSADGCWQAKRTLATGALGVGATIYHGAPEGSCAPQLSYLGGASLTVGPADTVVARVPGYQAFAFDVRTPSGNPVARAKFAVSESLMSVGATVQSNSTGAQSIEITNEDFTDCTSDGRLLVYGAATTARVQGVVTYAMPDGAVQGARTDDELADGIVSAQLPFEVPVVSVGTDENADVEPDGSQTSDATVPGGNTLVIAGDVAYPATAQADTSPSTAPAASAAGIPNAPTVIERRVGSTWRTVSSGRTDAFGQLGMTFKPTVTGDYRVVGAFASTPSHMHIDVLPSVPTGVAVTRGDRAATVSWAPPSVPGGSVTGYSLRWRKAGTANWSTRSVAGTSRSAMITGLVNGTRYEVAVAARTAVGASPFSAVQTITPATRPSAPVIKTPAPGKGSVVVPWVAPADGGGSPITEYVIRTYRGTTRVKTSTATASSRRLTVTGLTNGVGYTFTVSARNAVGVGTASAHSRSITPRP